MVALKDETCFLYCEKNWKEAFEKDFFVFKKVKTDRGSYLYRYHNFAYFYLYQAFIDKEKEIDEDYSLLTSFRMRLILFNKAKSKRKLHFATIWEKPSINKKIDVLEVHTSDFLGHCVEGYSIVPIEVNNDFSEDDIYIMKTENDIYFCYMR